MRRLVLFIALFSLAYAAEPVYLTLLSGPGDLVYISPSGQGLSSVPVGQRPREMAFSPDKRYLYITGGENTVSVIDVFARRKIGEIRLGDYRRPYGIAVHPKTGAIAVVTEAPAQLLLIDAVRRTVVKRFDPKGEAPTVVTFGPEGTWAYVSNTGSGTVAAVNIESGETKIIKTGDRPESSVLSGDGKELYVLNRDSDNIAVVDTAKHQTIANIIAGKGPERAALAAGGKTLAYTLRHERKIAFADVGQRKQTGYVIVPGEPISCAVSNDGQSALVSTATAGTIYIISIPGKKIIGEIKTVEGVAPRSVVELPNR